MALFIELLLMGVGLAMDAFAVSVCKDHIRFLTEVSGDEIEFEPKTETETRSFQEIFKEMAGRRFTSDDHKKEK